MLGVVLRNISDALVPRADEALQGQVVARGEGVVLVRLDKSAGVLACALVEGVLLENDLELAEVDGDGVLADNDAWVVFHVFDLAEPGVRPDVPRREPLGWVGVQDALHEIATVVADELGNGVVRVEDLLVEHVGFGVFER